MNMDADLLRELDCVERERERVRQRMKSARDVALLESLRRCYAALSVRANEIRRELYGPMPADAVRLPRARRGGGS